MALRKEEEERVRQVMDLILDVLEDAGVDLIETPPTLEQMKAYLMRAIRIAKEKCVCVCVTRGPVKVIDWGRWNNSSGPEKYHSRRSEKPPVARICRITSTEVAMPLPRSVRSSEPV